MKFPLTLTTVIHCGPCLIHIIGRRSAKGWTIHADGKFQGERKSKKDAIRLAEDACEPGVRATFTVEPKQA
jgi:hypothetical protein